jgi:hypothetical protein
VTEFIAQVGVGPFISLVSIVGGLMIPLVAIIGGFMYKSRKLHLEAALKQQMLDRGMSAEEIRDVLAASITDKPRQKCSRA